MRQVGSLSLAACCAVVASLTIGQTSAVAQTTRAGEIAEAQAEKARTLRPEEPPVGEVIVRRVMSSPLLVGSGGLYPWLGSVYSGTGLGAGVGLLHRGALDSLLSLVGAVTTNGSLSFDGRLRATVPETGERVRPFVSGRWSRLSGVPFYGSGLDTVPAERSVVDYRPRQANAGVSVLVNRALSVNGSYSRLGFSTDSDDVRTLRPLIGLGENLSFQVAQAGAMVDWRPSPGYATRGGFVRGDWSHYTAQSAAPYSFDLMEVETAHLFPFVGEQFGLAVRALATTTRTDGHDEVPFILLPSIGGGDTVRGLPNRRYQDRSRAVLTGEYRWRPARYLDMALFADSGTVAARLGDIDTGRFKTGYGIGARFHGLTFNALRLEVARGQEGWRLIFAGGQPF